MSYALKDEEEGAGQNGQRAWKRGVGWVWHMREGDGAPRQAAGKWPGGLGRWARFYVKGARARLRKKLTVDTMDGVGER